MSDLSKLLMPIDKTLPKKLYIIPLKTRPVFPGMLTPIVISQEKKTPELERIVNEESFVGLLLQKDEKIDNKNFVNLFDTGTIVKIIKKFSLPDGGMHLLVNSIDRFKAKKVIKEKPSLYVEVIYPKETETKKDKELIALTREVISSAKEMANKNPLFTEEMKLTLINVEEPGKIADFVSSMLNLTHEELQELIEIFSLKKRLRKTLGFLYREIELLNIQNEIEDKISGKLDKHQKEYYLREKLTTIKDELGLNSKRHKKNTDYYTKKIKALSIPEEEKEIVLEEAEKLEYIDMHSADYGVIRNYLDIIISLPWHIPKYKELHLQDARKILNKDHFGLEEIKDRIIEHLAVKKLRKDEKGSIICFVGPPGVGKTSLGQSIAKAMNTKFFRFSLGGMRDEAEIKGHRKTYIGAMPGKIIQALKVVGCKNPVIMLDEIDKLGSSYQGDPASALLEVLDPQQNIEFRDHFLDLPLDLSYITFITTANSLEGIPAPLIDRMEIIRLSGYILEEKVQIAKKYLIPKAIKESGLTRKVAPKLNMQGLKTLIDGYSREAGVRALEKYLKKIYRKAATAFVEKNEFPSELTSTNLVEIIGKERFSKEKEANITSPGCALGLAYTSMGGATLVIESRKIAGRGRIKLTGQLGKVMLESADIALTYVQTKFPDQDFWHKQQIHIHVPDGATPKDGPSAGITITSALISLYKDKIIKQGFAMTGEIRLTGEVLPIGGLKEKSIAARRIGIKKLIFPQENIKDWEELPDYLKKGIKVFPVSHYDEVYDLLF